MPMGGDPPIHPTEQSARGGQLADHAQWRHPPDLLREEDDCVGTCGGIAVAGQHAHLGESLSLGEAERLLNPSFLQWLEREAASREHGGKARREIGAGAAIAVVEDPAASRRVVCEFCDFC